MSKLIKKHVQKMEKKYGPGVQCIDYGMVFSRSLVTRSLCNRISILIDDFISHRCHLKGAYIRVGVDKGHKGCFSLYFITDDLCLVKKYKKVTKKLNFPTKSLCYSIGETKEDKEIVLEFNSLTKKHLRYLYNEFTYRLNRW